LSYFQQLTSILHCKSLQAVTASKEGAYKENHIFLYKMFFTLFGLVCSFMKISLFAVGLNVFVHKSFAEKSKSTIQWAIGHLQN